MFFAIAGALASALSSANAADAQRRLAKAVKNASEEDLPPIYQAQLRSIAEQSQRSQADFQKSLDDQDKLVKVVLIGGAVLLIVHVLLR